MRLGLFSTLQLQTEQAFFVPGAKEKLPGDHVAESAGVVTTRQGDRWAENSSRRY